MGNAVAATRERVDAHIAMEMGLKTMLSLKNKKQHENQNTTICRNKKAQKGNIHFARAHTTGKRRLVGMLPTQRKGWEWDPETKENK